MAVRQFNLKNKNGAIFDLMRKDAFFNNPDGLGWGVTSTVVEVGNAYIVTNEEPARPAPSGEMVFEGYRQYREFLDFAQAGGLVLGYKPIDKWCFLDVSISLGKAEIKPGNGRLVCPVDFQGLSQWYEALQAYQISGNKAAGKAYPYSYPYTYKNGLNSTIDVKNGQLPSYAQISIFGPVEDPQWALYQFGERVATGRLNGTIIQGHKLVVDSHPASMQIAEYSVEGEFVSNRYQDSDFSTERLFELPAGECQLVFTQSSASPVTAFVEVRKRV